MSLMTGTPQESFDIIRNENSYCIIPSCNVLDPAEPFSLNRYLEAVDILYALNVLRGFNEKPTAAELTVKDIGFAVDLKSSEPSTVIRYFSRLKGGCNVTGGCSERSRADVHFLDGQVGLWYFQDSNCIHVQKPNHSPHEIKPVKLTMKDMEDVMDSFDKLIKESDAPKILSETNCKVDVSIDYTDINAGVSFGKILLLLGGENKYPPQTQIFPTEKSKA
jgi:hypothetical protein